MKVRWVFDDWKRWNGVKRESFYNTERGVELGMGSLHGGSTFEGTIELDEDDAAMIREAWAAREYATFELIEPKEADKPIRETNQP